MNVSLILGGPGTGKTRTLLEVLDAMLSTFDIERIAFVSFTRKAVNEARDRAIEKFQLGKSKFHFFRTMHSLAYAGLGITQNQVVKDADLKDFSQVVGHEVTMVSDEEELIKSTSGTRMLFLEQLARSKQQSYEEAYTDSEIPVTWFEFLRFCETYRSFKDSRSIIDFTDMLEQYDSYAMPLPVDIAFVDEAQDLNPLQWSILRKIFANTKITYVAGDDDQAIYTWAGADVETFLNLKHNDKTVLPKSYRLPKAVFDLGNRVIEQVENRYEKSWTPQDREGEIRVETDIKYVDVTEGSWMFLSRNNIYLKYVKGYLRSIGELFESRHKSSVTSLDANRVRNYIKLQLGTVDDDVIKMINNGQIPPDARGPWFDALGMPKWKTDYFTEIMRNGYQLTDEPRIKVDTIHSSKGGEADNVVLLTDVRRESATDDEHRVFYVAVTRAKKRLFIITPIGNSFYDLWRLIP